MLEFGFYNMDCMEGMRHFPDKYFDLAIVDPPYGISYDTDAAKAAEGGHVYGNACTTKKVYHAAGWDQVRPDKEYFDELARVSKNQIIWGGQLLCRCFATIKGLCHMGQKMPRHEE